MTPFAWNKTKGETVCLVVSKSSLVVKCGCHSPCAIKSVSATYHHFIVNFFFYLHIARGLWRRLTKIMAKPFDYNALTREYSEKTLESKTSSEV